MFNSLQSLFVAPAVNDLWESINEKVWQTYGKEVMVLSGDGRMDSLGFSAKYCVYTIMDNFLLSSM